MVGMIADQGFFFVLFLAGAILLVFGMLGEVKSVTKLSGKRQAAFIGVGSVFMVLGLLGYLYDSRGNDPSTPSATPTSVPPILTPATPTDTSAPTPSPLTDTPTPVPVPPTKTPTLSVNVDEVLSNIVAGEGGIEKAAPWWKAVQSAGEGGAYDPTILPGTEGCFGVAWNAIDLDRTVVVFQSPQILDFQAGGWYVLICLTNNVELSATEVGRIQSEWLTKEYGGAWRVKVLERTTSSPVPMDSPTSRDAPTPKVEPGPYTDATNLAPCDDQLLGLGGSFGWVERRLSTDFGGSQIFSHCPPEETIEYRSIAVDDEISKVKLVCGEDITDITNSGSLSYCGVKPE